jgi:hypothetical protein
MTLKSFLLIADIQTALFAIGATLSFLKYKVRQHYVVLLGFTLVASVCGDISSFLLRGITNPNYAATVYDIIVFPLITTIYYNSVGGRHKRLFIFISIAVVLFTIINVAFIQKSSINSYTLVIQSIVIICYCLYYFYWLLRELPTSQLHLLPMFWINSAYILFFSGNLFLFVFTSYLVNVLNNDLLVYWSLHNVLGIIEGLMIIVALWMDLRNIRLLS